MRFHRVLLKFTHYRSLACRHQRTFAVSAADRPENNYFITTPIFYVNSAPHIGHLHTTLLADALSRWQRMNGRNVTFSTGTDEHGLKIQQAASEAGVEPLVFCDKFSSQFQQLFKATEMSNTDFVRTSENRHKAAVEHFWTTLHEKGHIYKGSYAGWYSTSDEAFLTDEQVEDATDDSGNTIKVSVESGNAVEWMEEENYKFRLSQFTEDLKRWITSGVIQPTKFADVALLMLENGMPDLSVSRETSRVGWGIPVPGDPTQCIYVWLDALVNYLTAVGYPDNLTQWPPNCQVIGKDILKFHAIYWPAFLMAAGMDPPKSLFVHSHWTIEGKKMSKSRGNVVDPMEKLNDFKSSELRYVLLREGVPHSDGNYSDLKVVEWTLNDLSNNLGNLLKRCVGRVNLGQCFPVFDEAAFDKIAFAEHKLALKALRELPGNVRRFYEEYNIYKSISVIMGSLRAANTFFQHQEPWRIRDASNPQLNTALAFAMETLRISGILLQPVSPALCDQLLTVLNVPRDERTFAHASKFSTVERKIVWRDAVFLTEKIHLRNLHRAISGEEKASSEANKPAGKSKKRSKNV